MDTLLRWLVVAAIFGVGGWAGYALSHPEPEASPARAPSAAPVPPPVPAAPLGDVDGTATAPSAPAPKSAPAVAPIRLTFADLSQWDLDPKDIQVPASVQAYAGKSIDIVGYVLPYGNGEAFEEFALVKDLGSCCFGQAPQPHHMIECKFVPGKKAAYIPGPMRVRGTFRVEVDRQGQYLISVFAMLVDECVEVR